MSKGYKQLTISERDLIGALKASGKSLGDIGKELGRDKSTISRELQRNGPPIHTGYYLSHKAHGRSIERRSKSRQIARLKSAEIKKYVSSKLVIYWSPELIAGRSMKKLRTFLGKARQGKARQGKARQGKAS